MSSSGQKTFNVGYRSWFQPFRYNQRVNLPIFVLDYETASFWEEQYDDYLDHENKGIQANTQLVNGIQVYFLDENLQKRKAFLRHEPYFYLLLEEGLSKHEKNRISNTIREIGESQVRHVEEGEYYDAANLTFLEKKSFMKVTVDRPGSVPNLRTKSEEINGVIEWREADVLFHHRTAIDHNVRVGSWYTADIAGGKIQTLTNIPNRAPPALRVLAFDIETVFEQTRDPTPNRDSISVISLFTGGNDSNGNILIVNSHVVETKDLQDFNILLKASDKDHSKPWVDWNTEKELQFDSEVIEKFPIKIIVTKNEKELLDYFYQFIREYQPDVITDFFGGRFDIPFLAVRSEKYGISFEKETGFQIVLKYRLRGKRGDLTDLKRNYSPNNFDYVAGAGIIHLDAYLFNEKYSYLPKKDLGLKPSVERKLKIIPIGREALFAIKDNPVEAIAYAASDGYITWKYVKEIVLDFFISMGQMFPVPASELLTRRSGSLDDLLIDAEDYQHQVIGKKRIGQTNIPSFSSGIVIESLAYTGGLVEARRPGLFRSDIYFDYEPNKMALESLKEIIRRAIKKESKNLVKSIEKEEFERLIGSELEDVRFEYSEDPILFLSQLETDLLKNGISAEEISKQLESIRKILEKTSTLHVVNVEQAISETCEQLDQLIALEGKTQLRGVHVDVTSMYPSQIRQYKLQPSGIVPLTMCRTCELREADDSCFFEGDWVIKLTARRPCRFKVEGSGKCDPNICTAEDETKCKKYDPSPHERSRSQEIFTFNQKKTEAYLLIDNSRLEQVPIGRTYLGSNTSEDPFVCLQRWLLNSVEATQLTTNLDQNQFDIFEDQPKELKLPSDTFMSLDVRTKKITVLLSVNSRVCQKAYNFVSRIMDDFFNTRVKHKIEAQRLKQVISQKLALNQPVNPDLQRQQKFHDSTQLGMKVPLNSIFPDEPIVIIDDEGIRPIQIGFFVNKYVNDGESSKNITENTKTFTFDDEGKISLKRITHVFKHKTD
ncbi:MAG: 3'-5' exonuclease, partial [Candidatus Hermodarchaeota archaeon]